MGVKTGSFREVLQTELVRRCSRNPQYSLRAFAHQLGIDHSTLSQLVRGKRPMSAAMIERLAERLGINREEIRAYAALESAANGRGSARQEHLKRLAHETAALVSDPCHYAILELTRLEDFRPDSRWIARVLGITPDEVNIAVSRLTRFRLLEMLESSRWLDRSGSSTSEEFSRVVVRRLAEEVREMDRS